MSIRQLWELPASITRKRLHNLLFRIRVFSVNSGHMKKLAAIFATLTLLAWVEDKQVVVLYDDFNTLSSGPMFASTGAHTEYHYLREGSPKGNWAQTTYRFRTQNAWKVFSDKGDKVIYQQLKYEPGSDHHPMLVAGNEFWQDYTLEAKFAPEEKKMQSGVVFRYRNDRCYYFFGVDSNKAVIKKVQHATSFRTQQETDLAAVPFNWQPGTYYTVTITVNGPNIRASFKDGPTLTVTDATFPAGKIALLADRPTKFSYVKVTMDPKKSAQVTAQGVQRAAAEKKLQEANPKLTLWKKINIAGFGVGRNLRFGDCDGDGQTDILVGQVVHHGPSDSHSELSCLTAITLDGKKLWQIGKPDQWKDHLTNDVSFQVHDIDNDGRNEVIYCMNYEIIVADAATGKTKYKAPTPFEPNSKPAAGEPQERILGDCLMFCDLSGKGYDGDIIIKNRYRNVWAFNNKLEQLWTAACNTGHYPIAYDVDKDGKEEVMAGYTLFNSDGTVRWTLENTLKDHADGVAIIDFKGDGQLQLICAGSDEGLVYADMNGKIRKHHFIGHAQNVTVANFRDDLPGLEAVTINFWANQGTIHFYDASGNIYHDFEPNQFGSMLMPLNWTGGTEEYFVHNANVEEGGIYDGRGRKVVVFPDDGHPDMCNATLNLTGDARDEIVVWNPEEIWVYTQSDSPKQGNIYRPKRNPLYNYSNYQATISLPK